jgi:hypothetical protein
LVRDVEDDEDHDDGARPGELACELEVEYVGRSRSVRRHASEQ